MPFSWPQSAVASIQAEGQIPKRRRRRNFFLFIPFLREICPGAKSSFLLVLSCIWLQQTLAEMRNLPLKRGVLDIGKPRVNLGATWLLEHRQSQNNETAERRIVQISFAGHGKLESLTYLPFLHIIIGGEKMLVEGGEWDCALPASSSSRLLALASRGYRASGAQWSLSWRERDLELKAIQLSTCTSGRQEWDYQISHPLKFPPRISLSDVYAV